MWGKALYTQIEIKLMTLIEFKEVKDDTKAKTKEISFSYSFAIKQI